MRARRDAYHARKVGLDIEGIDLGMEFKKNHQR